MDLVVIATSLVTLTTDMAPLTLEQETAVLDVYCNGLMDFSGASLDVACDVEESTSSSRLLTTRYILSAWIPAGQQVAMAPLTEEFINSIITSTGLDPEKISGELSPNVLPTAPNGM